MAKVSFQHRGRTKVADGVYVNWSILKGFRSLTLKPLKWIGFNTRTHTTSIDTPGPGGVRVTPDGTGKGIGLAIAAAAATALWKAVFSKPRPRRDQRRGRRR
jgi:hypothetical protein